MRIATCCLLLLLSVSCAASNGLRPLAQHQCWCDFSELDQKLQALYRPNQNHAELVHSFTRVVVSLNYRITGYFTDIRRCVKFWLQSPKLCDARCSCVKDVVCCRDSSVNQLQRSLDRLKQNVKGTITHFHDLKFLGNYLGKAFDVVSSCHSVMDFTRGLRNSSVKGREEAKHYTIMFSIIQKRQLLQRIFEETIGDGSVVERVAKHFRCDIDRVVPFYHNVYGVVLQYLLMEELNAELNETNHDSRSGFSEKAEWKQFLNLTGAMAKKVIFCSTTQIYQIRSEEIKEKGVAMRNAAIVFSTFLLILVLIIALIAVFACRASRDSGKLVVRDEPVVSSEESDNRDLLYKRHYEADETL